MDHQQAVRDGCTERYLIGDMDEQERDDFEAHYFECMECADDVKTAVAFVDNAREVLAEQTEQQVVQAAATAFSLAWWRRFGDPGGLAALAALLFVGFTGWQSLVLVPELRRQVAQAQAPQAVRWEFLSVSRSRPPEVRISPGHHLMGFRLSRSTNRSFPAYRCELQDAAGRSLQTAVIPAPPGGEELGLVLPASGLQGGTYVIVLSGLESPDDPVVAPELARYRFILHFDEEEKDP